jgi:hypothetical protein
VGLGFAALISKFIVSPKNSKSVLVKRIRYGRFGVKKNPAPKALGVGAKHWQQVLVLVFWLARIRLPLTLGKFA